MADFTMGETAGQPEDELARQARLAAMQRAMNPSAPVGPQGPSPSDATTVAPPQSPDAQDRNVAPAPSTGPGGIAGPAGPSGPVNQTDVMNRVLTGGSLGNVQSPDAAARNAVNNSPASTAAPYTGPTADQSAAIAKALADANAANAARNKTQTTPVPPQPPQPPQPPIQQPIQQPIQKTAQPGNPITNLMAGFNQQGAGGDTTTGAGGNTGIVDQTGGAGPGGNDGSGGGGSDLGSITNQLMSQIQGIGSTLANPGTPTDVTGVFLTQAKSILSMLDQQDAQLRSEADKNGTTVDPSTQFTIDKLRETLTENVKTVREDLNRRGISESGIALELENRLQKGSASDQARILADRLTNIQQQLTQGLASNRAARVSTLTSFGKGAAEAQTTHDENQYKSADERERAALSAMLGLRGQVNSADISAADNRSALQRALLQEQGQNSRSAATVGEDARQFNENFGMNKAKYNQDFAYNAQNDALNRAAAGARATAAVTQINNPYGGNTKTGNNVDAQATNAAISAIGNATSRDQAQTDLFKSAQALINAGVDVTAVQDAINSRFPAAQETIRGQRTVGGSI